MSSTLPPLLWHQPGWLLLLLLPPALLIWRRSRGKTNPRLEHHFEPALLSKLILGSHHNSRPHRLLALLWTLAAIAAAGPYLPGDAPDPAALPGANVAIVVDISPSMAVADVEPNRIELAKLQLTDFIRGLNNTRLALVTFSANAYPILPLTPDRATFIHFVQALDPTLVTIAGSNLGPALNLAGRALNEPADGGSPPRGLVILISDGGIHDPSAWREARKLKQAGHRLFTVGVGSDVGGPVPLSRGQLVRQGDEIFTSRLDRNALISLAAEGGGRYADISPRAWEHLRQVVSGLERAQYQNSTIASEQGWPLYPLLIATILVLLLIHAWRRPELLFIVLFVPAALLHAPQTQAAPWSESRAFEALQGGDYSESATLYETVDGFPGAFGRGVAAYRLGHWQAAASAFKTALSLAQTDSQKASASYNLGNTLAQLGQLEAAATAYQAALSLAPHHSGAKRNLGVITRFQQSLGANKSRSDSSKKAGATGGENNREQGASKRPASQQNGGQQPTEVARRWSRIGQQERELPAKALLQLHNIEDDSTTMLRRRFSIEDERAGGLIEEKPW